MSIYKDCDIRGVYLKELNDSDACNIGRALATLAPGKFCVGGDLRLSTPALKENLIRGLVDSGADVCDLGLIATPMLYFALSKGGFTGGAMVTASHNPPEYNGIKFMLGDIPVSRETIDAVEALINVGADIIRPKQTDTAQLVGADSISARGRVIQTDIRDEYIAFLTARFKAVRPMKIVVDACNGSMGTIAPEALRRCGYEVVELFCEPDGTFPNRTPNPAQYEKLTALKDMVVRTKSDLGVAFDADGDRAVFVDDSGEVKISERSLVLFIKWLLRDRPSAVVYDQKSSSVVRDWTLKMGGMPIPERSGHTFIKRRFLETGSAIAGEVSGHFFFGELGYDDALFATLTLLEALSAWNVTLHDAVKDVVCPPITPDMRFKCPYAEQLRVLAEVEKAFPEGRISHMDGVRVELDDGWLLARKSVTAEEITIRAEGRDEKALKAILDRLESAGVIDETRLSIR